MSRKSPKSDLILPWIVLGMMLMLLISYVIICHILGEQLQRALPLAKRELIRTVFYMVAITTFPMTNLIRHIQLRLNQTMPHQGQSAIALAKTRYLLTVSVSMLLIEVVGVFGLLMFILGDGFNTLYIFEGLSALGMFLYRPKIEEYVHIIDAIGRQPHE